MRRIPHTRGGSHHPNYERDTEFPSILFPDVDGSNPIAMPHPATRLVRTMENAPPWLALTTMTAYRTGARRVVFVLEHNAHPQSLSLVGELVANRAVRPLVDFLVVGGANIIVLPDIAHIPDHDGLDALFKQRRDKSGRALVFDILDLMFQFFELLLLGLDELLATAGAFFLAGNLALQLCDELIAVLPLRAQEPSIENVGVLPIMGDGHVDFPQVDARYLLPAWLHLRFLVIVRRNGLVLSPRPVDH